MYLLLLLRHSWAMSKLQLPVQRIPRQKAKNREKRQSNKKLGKICLPDRLMRHLKVRKASQVRQQKKSKPDCQRPVSTSSLFSKHARSKEYS